jgi:mevalonate kinase
MLYGEYTIIAGSEALAVPCRSFCGQWNMGVETSKPLENLVVYLSLNKGKFEWLDIAELKEHVAAGMYLDSNIPMGYGLGSSGALSAAVYDRFLLDPTNDISLVQKRLGDIESFFHGMSSGLDPLVSLYNQPFHITKDGPEPIEDTFQETTQYFWLLDSGIPRSTEPLVRRFREMMKDVSFEARVINEWSPIISKLIDTHIYNDRKGLESHLKALSELTFDLMKEFIPPPHIDFWQKGLEHDEYWLKLCGAGGGGMSIGYGKHPENADIYSI